MRVVAVEQTAKFLPNQSLTVRSSLRASASTQRLPFQQQKNAPETQVRMTQPSLNPFGSTNANVQTWLGRSASAFGFGVLRAEPVN